MGRLDARWVAKTLRLLERQSPCGLLTFRQLLDRQTLLIETVACPKNGGHPILTLLPAAGDCVKSSQPLRAPWQPHCICSRAEGRSTAPAHTFIVRFFHIVQ